MAQAHPLLDDTRRTNVIVPTLLAIASVGVSLLLLWPIGTVAAGVVLMASSLACSRMGRTCRYQFAIGGLALFLAGVIPALDLLTGSALLG